MCVILSKISQIEMQQSLHHWMFLELLWSASSLYSLRGIRNMSLVSTDEAVSEEGIYRRDGEGKSPC